MVRYIAAHAMPIVKVTNEMNFTIENFLEGFSRSVGTCDNIRSISDNN